VQARKALPFEQYVELGLSLTQALGKLHEHSLIHPRYQAFKHHLRKRPAQVDAALSNRPAFSNASGKHGG
jgi:hypothetical protein